MPTEDNHSEIEAIWRDTLTHGHPGRWAFLPSDPKCIVCRQPFRGLGGTLLRVFTGYAPSHMSPNVCNVCEVAMPQGGAEVDAAILFADVRGSTSLGEQLSPSQFAALLNRFYTETSDVLIAAQSWIDKLVGDEIMALYVPAMGPGYRRKAVTTGIAMLRAVGYERGKEPWLQVGVGIVAGPAYVGKVGAQGVNQVTALGDTVNTAARIQSAAAPGELLINETLYESVADLYPNAEQRSITVKGKDEAISVRVLKPAEM